jgi:ABC-type maltose transport system permease subunit
MLTPARTPRTDHDRDQTPAWIVLASMFVGQRLSRGAAVGAYAAATVTLAVSLVILFTAHH